MPPPAHTPRRLALLIHDLQSGGAQRVMATLANAWAAQGREVHLLTLEGPCAVPFFPLDPRVDHGSLGLTPRSQGLLGKIRNNAARLRQLRETLKRLQPDLLLSFIDVTNILALLGTAGLGLPVIISERVDPAAYRIAAPWRALRVLSYPQAAALVIQVPGIRAFFPAFLQDRIHVIPNPVVQPGTEAPAPEPGPRVLAVGRLSPYKGFDLLLEAFARVRSRHPAWRLDILGEGPERAALEAKAAHLGLASQVRLLGNRPDVTAQLRAAEFFVLSSRAEGFPNVLCEAMATGTPVVSFDCPTGPAEIIRPGLDGLLVPNGDVPALADAMDRLMTDPALRAALAARAPEVLDRFGEAAILAQWDACFRAALSGQGR